MPGNSFGHVFRVTTFGESHGRAVGCVVDGCPAGLRIKKEDIQKELDRRKPGGRLFSPRKEKDEVEILSGIFEEKTLGTPIAMVVYNKDVDSKPYEQIKNLLRPGHADYTYLAKFGVRDWRGGGRSSARETVGRVAAGAIAKKVLSQFGVKVMGYVVEIAGIKANLEGMDAEEIFERAEKSEIRCADYEAEEKMIEKIIEARKEGDSVGGVVEVVIRGLPAGVGEPVFMKLDAYLAYAMMSIPAVKGVEIGAGFRAARMKGSEMNDEMTIDGGRIKFLSNNAGGVLGGISTGEDVVVRLAVKPTPSISKRQRTVNIETFSEDEIVVRGRHDPCIAPRAVPVAEAMAAIATLDLMMMQNLVPRFF
ncbi:chorismate synthase [Ferroglobus placidus DSM 10642]|uniref:Chorismate synthase n=1 Tax=Ferroglobus placidus (strain DSM 10642 / AEDII12DO) TaxID=589924 RepID=D3RZX6_FERPA|nr:chorismate synthase [Ferroglobus placidus]ADC66039.1 chorismate synthase [Ferroglobus placidus DSM 10642]